jgi:thiamine pyrophosphokinase
MSQINGIDSRGLKWSISGLEFHPSKRVGTSNQTNSDRVKIELSGDGMLIILPRSCLTYVKNFFSAKNSGI